MNVTKSSYHTVGWTSFHDLLSTKNTSGNEKPNGFEIVEEAIQCFVC